MGWISKLKDLVQVEEEDYYEEEDEIIPEKAATGARESARRGYGLSESSDTILRREPVRESLRVERERENVIAMPKSTYANANLEKLTQRFKIVVIEPKAFDECPKLVDSLKSRKPVIINLEKIENDTARKIFDFLSGATYALNGNVQKIAQNIFVFLPENVDVATNAEPGGFSYSGDKSSPWK
jgi:cell division inhibitor SepF